MKSIPLFLSCLISILFFSCQEETETILLDNQNSFNKLAPLSSLIKRVSQYETTADNVLDGTSNCSIKLPVQVIVNNQTINVVSPANFQTIQNIKNQSNTDDDIVHFGFPITLIYPNFTQQVVANEAQYNAILAGYGDDSPNHDISCINFNYPIKINGYNTLSQLTNSITIQNDSQLYNFVNNLLEDQIVGFVYPLTLTDSNNQNTVVTSNSELETAIEDNISSCNSSVPSPPFLTEVLISGSWRVSYYYEENDDETSNFNGYNFNFYGNGTSIAIKAGNSVNGNWVLQSETTHQVLELSFTGSQLEGLEEDWKVLEYTTTSIRLKHEIGGESNNTYLNFTRN